MAKPQAEKTRIVLSELNAAFGKLDRTLLVAEILFVAGWSLMWASSLDLMRSRDGSRSAAFMWPAKTREILTGR
jgi:hypothetical protein